MKKGLFSLVLFFASIGGVFADGIVASVSHATYDSPKGAFVDIFVEVLGSSMHYIKLENKTYEARLGVIVTIVGEGGVEVHDSITLVSPKSDNMVDFKHAFRYPLEDGHYEATVDLYDIYIPDGVLTAKFVMDLDYDVEHVRLSDVLLLSDYKPSIDESIYVKSGLQLGPLPFMTCAPSQNQLPFYFEIYGTEDFLSAPFIVKTEIFKDSTSNQPMSVFYKRVEPREIIPMLLVSDISKLESGYYILRVSVLDKSKTLRDNREVGFTRLTQGTNNRITGLPLEWVKTLSPGDLEYSLKALAPILPGTLNARLNTLLQKKDIRGMQTMLSKVWLRRSPRSSEEAYKKYMAVARQVDKKFHSGLGYGFESDRGRIYMKYGAPSQIIEESAEPTAFPYEIWIYNKVPDGQTNIKFLFYNPSLAAGQMVLLHTNAVGELYNDKWERVLYSKATSDPQPANYLDEKHAPDGFMRRAREYFESN